jgi:hypothetical protein
MYYESLFQTFGNEGIPGAGNRTINLNGQAQTQLRAVVVASEELYRQYQHETSGKLRRLGAVGAFEHSFFLACLHRRSYFQAVIASSLGYKDFWPRGQLHLACLICLI